ncbi:MAG: hypothetical protein EHM53_11435 [Methanoregulaceae archaeon]|nr:MAG: hypothetical protein EHM53_11435 [Methanoregulaceae archaeon]
MTICQVGTKRPNAIGLSVVRLTSNRGNILNIEDVDIPDGTPLLDIKPYVPAAISPAERRGGEKTRRCPAADKYLIGMNAGSANVHNP